MGYDTLYVEGRYITYNHNRYDYMNFFQEVKLPKKRKIFILGERLYIKKIKVKNKITESFINKIIKELFGTYKEYLFHYEVKDKNILFYGIKQAKVISKLCESAKNISVNPIQFYIIKKFKKSIKLKKWSLLFKINSKYYLCKVVDNDLIEEKMEENFKDIKKDLTIENLFVDESIKEIGDIQEYKSIRLEGINLE